jgi:hypothetical protein
MPYPHLLTIIELDEWHELHATPAQREAYAQTRAAYLAAERRMVLAQAGLWEIQRVPSGITEALGRICE